MDSKTLNEIFDSDINNFMESSPEELDNNEIVSENSSYSQFVDTNRPISVIFAPSERSVSTDGKHSVVIKNYAMIKISVWRDVEDTTGDWIIKNTKKVYGHVYSIKNKFLVLSNKYLVEILSKDEVNLENIKEGEYWYVACYWNISRVDSIPIPRDGDSYYVILKPSDKYPSNFGEKVMESCSMWAHICSEFNTKCMIFQPNKCTTKTFHQLLSTLISESEVNKRLTIRDTDVNTKIIEELKTDQTMSKRHTISGNMIKKYAITLLCEIAEKQQRVWKSRENFVSESNEIRKSIGLLNIIFGSGDSRFDIENSFEKLDSTKLIAKYKNCNDIYENLQKKGGDLSSDEDEYSDDEIISKDSAKRIIKNVNDDEEDALSDEKSSKIAFAIIKIIYEEMVDTMISGLLSSVEYSSANLDSLDVPINELKKIAKLLQENNVDGLDKIVKTPELNSLLKKYYTNYDKLIDLKNVRQQSDSTRCIKNEHYVMEVLLLDCISGIMGANCQRYVISSCRAHTSLENSKVKRSREILFSASKPTMVTSDGKDNIVVTEIINPFTIKGYNIHTYDSVYCYMTGNSDEYSMIKFGYTPIHVAVIMVIRNYPKALKDLIEAVEVEYDSDDITFDDKTPYCAVKMENDSSISVILTEKPAIVKGYQQNFKKHVSEISTVMGKSRKTISSMRRETRIVTDRCLQPNQQNDRHVGKLIGGANTLNMVIV